MVHLSGQEDRQREHLQRQGEAAEPYSLDKGLLGQQLGSGLHRRTRRLLHQAYFDRHIGNLSPNTFEKAQQAVDKAFCAAWVDDQHVLVGTKCNTLLCLHTPSRTHTVISYPQQPVHRQGPDVFTGPSYNCGQHAIAVSTDGRFVVTGGQHTQDIVLWQFQHGSSNTRHPTTSLKPLQTFMGHVDWVFGLAWTSSNTFVSAGRDKTIKLWQLPEIGDCGARHYSSTDPGAAALSVKFHKDKVRAISFDSQHQQLSAVCGDGSISWWSPDLLLRGSCLLPTEYEEPVAVQSCGSVMVVGCKQEALLIDTRIGQPVVAVRTAPGSHGSKRRRVDAGAAAAVGLANSPQQSRQEATHPQQQDGQLRSEPAAADMHTVGYQQAAQEAVAPPMQEHHQQEQLGSAQGSHVSDSYSSGYDSESDDVGGSEDNRLEPTARSRTGIFAAQFIQQQLQLGPQPAQVHYMYQRLLDTQQQHHRSAAGRLVGSVRRRSGFKRLLGVGLEGCGLPEGVTAAAGVEINAQLTGQIALGDSGVRSLSLQHHLLGIGTGAGDLLWHDMRRMSSCKQTTAAGSAVGLARSCLSNAASVLGSRIQEHPCTGFAAAPSWSGVYNDPDPRWRDESRGVVPARVHKFVMPASPARYDDALAQVGWFVVAAGGIENPPAVYTHCWDPCGMKLFVGGGPLQLGLAGCSLAVLSA